MFVSTCPGFTVWVLFGMDGVGAHLIGPTLWLCRVLAWLWILTVHFGILMMMRTVHVRIFPLQFRYVNDFPCPVNVCASHLSLRGTKYCVVERIVLVCIRCFYSDLAVPSFALRRTRSSRIMVRIKTNLLLFHVNSDGQSVHSNNS